MTRAEGVEEAGPTEFLFDVEALARMDEAGVFGSDDARVELRHGRLLTMAPVGSEHARATPRLVFALMTLVRRLGRPDLEVVEGTLVLSDREAPVPDAAVVSGEPSGPYFEAGQAVLAVEVARSSLDDDLSGKRDAYARASVSEYWVVDLIHRRLHVFRRPHGATYGETQVLGPGDRVSPLFADGEAEIAVADLFA